MRKLLISLTALVAGLASAQAQQGDPISQATINIVRTCSNDLSAYVSQAEIPCSCTAGVLGGALPDYHYYLFGRIVPYTDTEARAIQEIEAIIAEGQFSVDDVIASSEAVIALAPKADQVCGVLEEPSTLLSVSLNTSDWPMIDGLDTPAIMPDRAMLWATSASNVFSAAAEATLENTGPTE